MSDAQQPVFNIEKLFVKDLSLEVPNAPAIYMEREAPQIDVNMSTSSRAMGEDLYHTSITVTVTAKIGDKTMFLVECTQAGVFRIQNVPQDQIPMVLGIGCPNIVFPYLRETVSRRGDPRRLPAAAAEPGQFRSAVPAATAGAAATERTGSRHADALRAVH
jgi:preprotein translocase subunit SecB